MLMIGLIDSTSNITIFYVYNLSSTIYHVDTADDAIYFVIKNNNSLLNLYIYRCLDCLYSGTMVNGSLLNLSSTQYITLNQDYFFFMELAFDRRSSTPEI